MSVARRCSADFQSAVSRNCILRSSGPVERTGIARRPADYKSAIQQIENLRYDGASVRPHSEMRPSRRDG